MARPRIECLCDLLPPAGVSPRRLLQALDQGAPAVVAWAEEQANGRTALVQALQAALPEALRIPLRACLRNGADQRPRTFRPVLELLSGDGAGCLLPLRIEVQIEWCALDTGQMQTPRAALVHLRLAIGEPADTADADVDAGTTFHTQCSAHNLQQPWPEAPRPSAAPGPGATSLRGR